MLVHGTFEDASIWWGVIERLQPKGYKLVAFGNPSQGVAVDAANLRSLLGKIEGPIVLAAHSYGRAVITQAGDDPKVKALVYAGSILPAVGESSTQHDAPRSVCADRQLRSGNTAGVAAMYLRSVLYYEAGGCRYGAWSGDRVSDRRAMRRHPLQLRARQHRVCCPTSLRPGGLTSGSERLIAIIVKPPLTPFHIAFTIAVTATAGYFTGKKSRNPRRGMAIRI